MDNLTRFLLDFFLFRNFAKFARNQAKKVQDWLSHIKPFSWEATLLLSLFSWFVYLLVQGFYAKKIVSIFGWLFLILGVDWALLGKKVTIPLIGFKFQHGPWITGAIASAAFLSNDFIITDLRGALISWPIFSAVFAGYTRFIQPGLRWQLPTPEGRQELVLLFLLSGLFSCWFQFHFLVQDVLELYPNLLADNFDRSSFVMQLNRIRRPTSKGYPLLEAVESEAREDLAGKNWIEAQRWLRNIDSVESDLGRRAIDAVYGDQMPREQQLWQITADTTFKQASVDLVLRAKWRGASSRLGGYTLRRLCIVSEVAVPPPQTFEDLQAQAGNLYQMTCQTSEEERS